MVSTPVRGDARARVGRFAVPLICLAQLMATLDVTIVNLALPAIQRDLSLDAGGLAWVIDAYTLAYAGLLLVGGRTGDLLGHRRTLMAGIAVFTASSLIGGLADGPGLLLAARVGQGMGAALATPTTLSLITTLIPVGPLRTRAMVAYGAMAGLGITLGLVLGGVLTQTSSWRWVFLVNVPIGALVLLAAPRVLPESRGARRRLDLVGALLGTGALTALVYGVIGAGGRGWTDGASVAALLGSGLLFVVFAIVQSRHPEPTLPLRLLRHRVRLSAYVVAGLLFAGLYPSFLFLSRTLQDALGQSPIEAGLRFLPIGLGVLVFAVVTRRLLAGMGRHDRPALISRRLVLGGVAATAAGMLGLATMSVHSSYAALVMPCLVGLGAGVGTTFVANAAVAMTEVVEADAGIASGLLSTFQAVGATIGVAVLTSIAASASDAATSAQPLLVGFSHGFRAAGALARLALVVAWIGMQRRAEP